MALLSGLELIFVTLMAGALILIGLRSRRDRSGLNFLPYVIIAVLLLAILTLSGAVFSLIRLVLVLGLLVAILLGLFAYKSARHLTSTHLQRIVLTFFFPCHVQ